MSHVNRFFVPVIVILCLLVSFAFPASADTVGNESSQTTEELINEVSQFDSEVSSKLEAEPTASPVPTSTPTPDEELLKEFKEYRHDSTQLLQYILLFLCICCGIVLCCCAVRFMTYI